MRRMQALRRHWLPVCLLLGLPAGAGCSIATGDMLTFFPQRETLLPTAKEATLAPLVAPVHLTGTITDPQVMGDATDVLNSAGHLLLGIVDPLSLATPILHPDRSGDMPCRDPRAFAGGQPNPVERVGEGAVDVMEGVGHGIGAAIERLGKGASSLLDDLIGR